MKIDIFLEITKANEICPKCGKTTHLRSASEDALMFSCSCGYYKEVNAKDFKDSKKS